MNRVRCMPWLLLISFCLLAGCYTVPETGRKSINLASESTMKKEATAAYRTLKKETPVSKDPIDNERVTRVGSRVVEAASRTADLPSAQEWEFTVFQEDETINAFAMPGGKIGVFTGMLQLAKDDNELAVVLGHEVAHVAARHSNERYSHQLLIAGTGVGLGVALGAANVSTEKRIAAMAAFGLGTMYGVSLPFSRRDESEADHIGLLYSARAGYDPRVAVPFWQKMGQASAGKGPPEFLSTHPSYKTRMTRLEELMPQAMEEYRKARKSIDEDKKQSSLLWAPVPDNK